MALSNWTIFISGGMRLILNFNVRHPLKPWATLIDYDIVMIMMPWCIVGSAIGIIVNPVIPQLIIVIIMTVTLFFLLLASLHKQYSMYKNEIKLDKAREKNNDPEHNPRLAAELDE